MYLSSDIYWFLVKVNGIGWNVYVKNEFATVKFGEIV